MSSQVYSKPACIPKAAPHEKYITSIYIPFKRPDEPSTVKDGCLQHYGGRGRRREGNTTKYQNIDNDRPWTIEIQTFFSLQLSCGFPIFVQECLVLEKH